jgi:hypothetical protein
MIGLKIAGSGLVWFLLNVLIVNITPNATERVKIVGGFSILLSILTMVVGVLMWIWGGV